MQSSSSASKLGFNFGLFLLLKPLEQNTREQPGTGAVQGQVIAQSKVLALAVVRPLVLLMQQQSLD